MVKKCTQCKTEQEDEQFISQNNRTTLTCTGCRERSLRCNNKYKDERIQLSKNWKHNNKEYIKLYNEFYRSNVHLPQEERELLLQQFKKNHGIEDKVKGVPSAHRKQHHEMNGIIGKYCSIPMCGWKPLTEYNYKYNNWDKLRTTCKACLSMKRKRFSYTISPKSKQNIHYRINLNIRGRILMSINDKKLIKKQKIINYLGCTIDDFIRHIECTFTTGMSWDKYGHYIDQNGIKQIGFHIDHIIPCAAFNLNDPYQLLLCFHWKNCQAMWGIENMSKNAKYDVSDKIKYIESQKNLINQETAEKLVKDILEQIKKEKQKIEQTIKENEVKQQKQKELYKDYLHDQCLKAIQIMFFMYENNIHEKSYKSTPNFIMRNKESRKHGSENPLSKRVCRLSLDGVLLGMSESMKMAAMENKTFQPSISKCCSNPDRLLSSGGFRWCFEHNLDTVQHRARFSLVLKQLCASVKKYHEPKKKQPIQPMSDEIRKKISISMKRLYNTEEGRLLKKLSFVKRAETMKARSST